MCVSHFARFSEFFFFFFFPIFQVLLCVSLIFHVFQFSAHIPGPIVCISRFPRF